MLVPRSLSLVYLALICLLMQYLCFPFQGVAAAMPSFRERPEIYPLTVLPDHIEKVTPAGGIHLHADFAGAKDDLVTIYLINATSRPVSLSAQDGDIYCKREASTGTGNWHRCDDHLYTRDCGNSYTQIAVPGASYRSWRQRLNDDGGDRRRIRFKLYNFDGAEVASNEGFATISADSLAQCRYDEMAIQGHAPLEDVLALLAEKMQAVPGNAKNDMPLHEAIGALCRFKDDTRMPEEAFQLLRKFRNIPKGSLTSALHDSTPLPCYVAAMSAVTMSKFHTPGKGPVWSRLKAEFEDDTNPWSASVLRAMADKRLPHKAVRPLVDKTLADSSHPAFVTALTVCSVVFEKPDAEERLLNIALDFQVPEPKRLLARDLYESCTANPHLKLEVEFAPYDQQSIAPSLKSVKVTNVSALPLTLPTSNLEDLVIVRMVVDEKMEYTNSIPKGVFASVSKRTLDPGETVEIKNIEWWRGLDIPSDLQGKSAMVTVVFATPGICEIPAKIGTLYPLNWSQVAPRLQR